jgi:tetratricopeptide (TPR) repeat protein
MNSKRYNEIQDLFLSAHDLYEICSHVEKYEVLGYWHACSHLGSGELDELISGSIMYEIQNWSSSKQSLISFVDTIGHFLYEAGYIRELLLGLREISLALEDERQPKDLKKMLISKANLGNLFGSLGMWDKSICLLKECSEESIRIFGKCSLQSIQCLRSLFQAYRGKEDLVNAEIICNQLLLVAREAYRETHPEVTHCKLCLAGLRFSNEDFEEAHSIYTDALETAILFYGHGSREVLDIQNNLVSTLWAMKKNEQAKAIVEHQVRALRAARDTTERYGYSLNLRAAIYYGDKDYAVAEASWLEALELYERTQDADSPDKITILNNLGTLYHQTEQYDKALSVRIKQIKMAQRLLGKTHPDALNAGINFAHLFSEAGEPARSVRMLESQKKVLEAHDYSKTRLYQRCLRLIGVNSRKSGDYRLSEENLKNALLIATSLEPHDHDGISALMAGIAKTLDLAGQPQESIEWRMKCLAYREESVGDDSLSTNRARYDLASALYKSGFVEESILQLAKIESSIMMQDSLGSDEQKLIDEVADLRFAIEGT